MTITGILLWDMVGYDRTDNECRPQAELSDAGDDVDIALREPQLVLQRIGEETKRITERKSRGGGGQGERDTIREALNNIPYPAQGASLRGRAASAAR